MNSPTREWWFTQMRRAVEGLPYSLHPPGELEKENDGEKTRQLRKNCSGTFTPSCFIHRRDAFRHHHRTRWFPDSE